MTTIAYKDGILAYDSRTTRGDIIISDATEKGKWVDHHFFVMTGAVSDFPRFIDIFFGKGGEIKDCDVHGLIVTPKKELLYCGIDKDTGIWKQILDKAVSCAIGSGSTFAFTAMDCGKSAKGAVKMAIKRDCHSGGIVREFVINEAYGSHGL